MIIYRHPAPTVRTPPWLAGWSAIVPDPSIGLVTRETSGGPIVGIGDPLLFDVAEDAQWADVGGGWQASLREPLEPRWMLRAQLWCDVADVPDLHGRGWAVPVVLNAEGKRAFRVAYGGPDFLPVLTAAQSRALDIARAARDALEEGDIDLAVGCRWLAALLPLSMHAPEQAFAALGLIDDRLLIGGLAVATGLPLKIAG